MKDKMNKIHNIDCLLGMNDIPDKSVDMILCDLPYGTTACAWDTIIPFEPLWEQYKRIIKDNGAIVLFGSEPFSTMVRMSNFDNYKYDNKWIKSRSTGFQMVSKRPLKDYEDIMVFYKKQPTFNQIDLKKLENPTKSWRKNGKGGNLMDSKLQTDKNRMQEHTNYNTMLIKANNEHNSGDYSHPTQKPVLIMEKLIKTYTNENDLVLDNCMGSGTTAIACVNTKRNYIGYEMNKTYFDLATARIDKHIKEFNCEVGLFAPTQKELF